MKSRKKHIHRLISVGEVWHIVYDTGAFNYVMGISIGDVCKKVSGARKVKGDIISVNRAFEESFSAN